MIALAIGLPILVASALALRPALPPISSTDARLAAASGFTVDTTDVWRRVAADGGGIDLEVSSLSEPSAQPAIAIRPARAPLAPDLLVYWVPAGATAPGDGAVLLGVLAGRSARRLALPGVRDAASGEVIVYSLAHAEVLARFEASALFAQGAR